MFGVWLHTGAGRLRLRGPPELGQRGSTGSLHLVAAGLRPPAQERERAQGEGGGGVPPRPVQRAVPPARISCLLAAQPPEAAVALAQGALRRGGEVARSAARRRRQVPRPEEVPATAHHLGRRGDVVLFQGAIAHDATRMVRAQHVPVAAREARVGGGDRVDDDAS